MKKLYYVYAADKGKHFVLTESGYNKTPDRVKPEREIGKPIGFAEFEVPHSWINNGWVKEEEM